MTSLWEDYLASARELDECRRQAASAAAAQESAVEAVRRELAGVQRRAALGQARLRDVAIRAGLPPPAVLPVGPVRPAADPDQASAALRAARAGLDAADAALSEAENPSGAVPLAGWSPAARNSLVYGGFAFVVLIAQVILLLAVSGTATSVLAMGCAVVLPVFGYGLAWLTVGLIFHGAKGATSRRVTGWGPVERTPVLGAAICAAPVVLICAGLGVSALL